MTTLYNPNSTVQRSTIANLKLLYATTFPLSNSYRSLSLTDSQIWIIYDCESMIEAEATILPEIHNRYDASVIDTMAVYNEHAPLRISDGELRKELTSFNGQMP